jgi:hypothetical protein
MKNGLSYIDRYNDSNGMKAGITSAVFATVGIALMLMHNVEVWFLALLFLIFGAVIGKLGMVFTGDLDGKMPSCRMCKGITVLNISMLVIHVLVTVSAVVLLALGGGR